MKLNECYFVGKITRTHGLKGDVLINLDTDEPESYSHLSEVFVLKDGDLLPYKLKDSTLYKDRFLKCKISGKSLEEIEKYFIGLEVYLPLKDLPKLSGTNFYYHEILGFQIFKNPSESIGVITKIVDNVPNHLFCVKNEQNEFYIPIVHEWILEVNRKDKLIRMNLPDGIDAL